MAALLGLATPAPADDTPPNPGTVRYRDIVEQFREIDPDPQRVADIRDLVLTRDVGTFHLDEGRLILAEPIEGRVCALLFTGRGRFTMTPPTVVERAQLRRFTDRESVDREFRNLVIFFSDSTAAEMERRLTFTAGRISREERAQLRYAVNYLGRRRGDTFDPHLMKTILEDWDTGLFYSHFSESRTEPSFFVLNPLEWEEVRYQRRFKAASYLYLPETITQFHLQRDYRSGDPFRDEPERDFFRIHHYRIRTVLEGSRLDFSATAEVDLESLHDGQTWAWFRIFEDMKMDTVRWAGSDSAAHFFKSEDNPILWVRLPRRMDAGDTATLHLRYHGELLERRDDWFFIRASRGWYPIHGLRQRATFDLSFRYPERFQFASVGSRIFSDTTAGEVLSRWVLESPAPVASFNVGFFKPFDFPQEGMPDITVLISEDSWRRAGTRQVRSEVGSSDDMEQQVGEDVVDSFRLFQNAFGPRPGERFYATEIPFRHGEAFPGLIHLSWLTFEMTSERGDDEVFRAHEVAHQWWGIGVDGRSYHDVWLSEGIAEYCGWWYFQEVVRQEDDSEDRFHRFLRDWRERILSNRKFLLGSGQEAAPIWLGPRTWSSDTEGDYTLIIYKKGAWVLHMLRMMLRDTDSGSDSVFTNILTRFYREYEGRKASTEDFIATAETVSGRPLGWFFDQWVYGAAEPRYRVAHTTEADSSGAWWIRGRIRQEAVPLGFRMPLLFGVEVDDGPSIVAERVWVNGPVTFFELGPYAARPRDLNLNYHEAVLGDFDRE